MQFVKINPDNKARGKDVFGADACLNIVSSGGTVGFILEDNMYILDLDAKTQKASFVAEYIISKYPNIVAFKTPKEGGYHFVFRSPAPLKAGVGFMTIFGFTIDIKKAHGHGILPDNCPGRAYINGCYDAASFIQTMEHYSVFISPQELRELIPYSQNVRDPIDLTDLPEGTRNETIFKWLCRWARFRGAKELDDYAQVISKIAQFPLKEIRNSIKSINKYVEVDDAIEEQEIDGMIVGKELRDVTCNVISYIKRTRHIEYDICTGNYITNLKMSHKNTLSQREMWTYFRIYYKDKIKYWREKNNEMVYSPLSEEDLKSIFEAVSLHCTVNSRIGDYEAIPEWDKVPRISTFLKKYYDCDARPTFFWLFMTSIVGKLKEPEECYVPFFFDLVGEKGTGKSMFFARIMGRKYHTHIEVGSRPEDICVSIYSKGAVIAVDDECKLTEGKGFNVWSEDKLKAFVTEQEDVFSRKYQNVERHPRGFVLCRTSNQVRGATDADERRQIIFHSKLPPRECRIMPERVPDAFFQQLLAEAKDYYERNGVYKMTQEDWDAVAQQQAEYTDDENKFTCELNKFLADIFEDIKNDKFTYCAKKHIDDAEYVTTWNHYNAWVEANKAYAEPMSGKYFWKNIRAIEQKTGIVGTTSKRIRVGGISMVQAALLYPKQYNNLKNYEVEANIAVAKKKEQQQVFAELPDMEY